MSAVSKTFFAALVSTAAHHDAVGVQGVKLRMEQINGDAPNQPAEQDQQDQQEQEQPIDQPEQDQQEDQQESFEDLEMPPQVEQDALLWAKNGLKMEWKDTDLGKMLHLMEATGATEMLGPNMTQETLEEMFLNKELEKYNVDFEGKNWNFEDKQKIYCRIQYLVAELGGNAEGLNWDDLEDILAAVNNPPPPFQRMQAVEIPH